MLERVRLLNGVTWEWRDRRRATGDGRPRAIGLIAQDVQEAIPEAVVPDRRDNLTVDPRGGVGAPGGEPPAR